MYIVTFQNQEHLEKALAPLIVEEVLIQIEKSTSSKAFRFQLDESVTGEKQIPLRNPGVGNLLKTEVYKTEALTVFYPEAPRVPHHLTIALNRKNIRGLSTISAEENEELFATIKKIAEIYQIISVRGFVIAQFDTPQEGHLGRCVVEILPHTPGFKEIKNIVDKVECNRYLLFRNENLSTVAYRINPESILQQAQFWQQSFQKPAPPLVEKEIQILFPYTRKESHQMQAEELLYHHLLQIFENKGAHVSNLPPFEAEMSIQAPETVKSVTVTKCAFCDPAVAQRQLVYEYENVAIFYNIRKGNSPGSSFLVLPKRHVEKVYGLNPSEIRNMAVVRKALIKTLKETHPECEVVVYTQDDPAVGQTVFHSHEQIIALNPKMIALTWTLMSLCPNQNVSDEEMIRVRKEFGLKLAQKLF